MLDGVTADGQLTWYCQAREEQGDPPCNILNTVHLDELVYREAVNVKMPGRGAVIMLPACACGARAHLKADYTLKELYKAVQVIEDKESGAYTYVLPLRYIHNLIAHWLLYESGKAAYAPVLDMPPQLLLDHPSFEGVRPSTIQAMWLGYSVVRQIAPQLIGAGHVPELLAIDTEKSPSTTDYE